MMANLIALITDFGNSDWYVGVMKGVIYKHHPKAKIVDINHQISSQNINEAAFNLWNAFKHFPRGTVFLSVVDPGVGSDREIFIYKTENYVFIAPDNGLLDLVQSETTGSSYILKDQLMTKRLDLNSSKTFHGRDIFAPLAAFMASGQPCNEFLLPYERNSVERAFVQLTDSVKRLKVLHVDHFGNVITNGRNIQGLECITINSNVIPIVSTYAEVESGALLALTGSSGLLEISVRNGNACEILGVSASETIDITLK